MKDWIFLILMHRNVQVKEANPTKPPLPYLRQIIGGSTRPSVSFGITPLGARHWEDTIPVYFCYLIIRCLSITCLLEIPSGKKRSVPNGGKTAGLRNDSSWSARKVLKGE